MKEKKLIINFENNSNDFKELVQEAFNMDILNFLVSKETISKFENIDRVNTYSRDLDLSPQFRIYTYEAILNKVLGNGISVERSGFFKELKSKEDEIEIINLSKTGKVSFVIVSAKDWKIIPFENLIAEMHSNETDLIAKVENVAEAELMLKTLEIGVDGILMTPKNANDLVDLKNLLHTTKKIELTKATILNIQNIPESHRVCVDTTTFLDSGEGILVGSTAMGFVLVHAEVFETEFVASRPFRVNAGDVSAYILVPDNDPEKIYRTNYLSELKGGKAVLAVNNKGVARVVYIGRIKIENRPMLRFELEATIDGQKIPISCICQNAETIRLVDVNGNAISVVDIKKGNEVLVHIGSGATHIGTAIEETIIEK